MHLEPELKTSDPGKSQKADDEGPSWGATPQPWASLIVTSTLATGPTVFEFEHDAESAGRRAGPRLKLVRTGRKGEGEWRSCQVDSRVVARRRPRSTGPGARLFDCVCAPDSPSCPGPTEGDHENGDVHDQEEQAALEDRHPPRHRRRGGRRGVEEAREAGRRDTRER